MFTISYIHTSWFLNDEYIQVRYSVDGARCRKENIYSFETLDHNNIAGQCMEHYKKMRGITEPILTTTTETL